MTSADPMGGVRVKHVHRERGGKLTPACLGGNQTDGFEKRELISETERPPPGASHFTEITHKRYVFTKRSPPRQRFMTPSRVSTPDEGGWSSHL